MYKSGELNFRETLASFFIYLLHVLYFGFCHECWQSKLTPSPLHWKPREGEMICMPPGLAGVGKMLAFPPIYVNSLVQQVVLCQGVMQSVWHSCFQVLLSQNVSEGTGCNY